MMGGPRLAVPEQGGKPKQDEGDAPYTRKDVGALLVIEVSSRASSPEKMKG